MQARFSNKFKEGIELLDFETGNAKDSNLLFTNDFGKKTLEPEDMFLLETAKTYEADAVYIRRFQDNRRPIAQIYIYDNTSNNLTDQSTAEIHRKLWSSCVIPVFIVINSSKILIYDSRKPVTILGEELVSSPIETLEFVADAVKQYSAKLFDNGVFWELKENQNHFLSNTSAYEELIDGLKRIRSKFISESGLPPTTAHKLLVQSILIKYLEERGDEGGSAFAKTFFKRNFEAKDFCDLLRKKGKIIDLFDKLSEQFNGRVFEWSDREEIKNIKTTDLSSLANYLDGDNKNNQYVIWQLYSFAHLPVELISSVYEEFLGKEKKDVVYTPDFLVSLLIEEALPLNTDPNLKVRLLDGSCGSGIFLVKGFKRLVQRWRYAQYQSTKNLAAPNLKTLKSTLKDSIFGVDIEEDAVRLSIFSLALALCDMLTPKQIWTELKFDNLFENNILSQDFFEFVSNNQNHGKFDLIIGNPPFKELNKSDYDQIIKKNKLTPAVKIPQNQIALLYLEQAVSLLKEKGKLCLILPAGPIIYNDTFEFRNNFFSKYNVSQVVDFTNLSANLFGKANVAVVALFAENSAPNADPICHITVRDTKASKEKLYFELDHYDFHLVDKDEAKYDKYVWKSNLLGGGRIGNLINRLTAGRSLRQFLEIKVKENSWNVGEGFIRGTAKDKTADYLTNKKAILGKNLNKKGFKYEHLDVKYFYRRGPKELFSAPLLLIKEIIEDNHIPTAYLTSDTPFDSRIVGIHAPQKEKEELKELHAAFTTYMKTFVFYIISTSSQSLVSFATAIQKKDIMNLPYPEKLNDLKLSYTEKILRDDVLNFQIDFLLKGDNPKINYEASTKEIESFSEVFCKAINSIYKQNTKEFALCDAYESSSLYCCVFKYGNYENKKVKWHTQETENIYAALLLDQSNTALRVNRVLKIYEQNKIIIIKPKRIRYWLKSIALRDVDETLGEILDA